MSRIRCIGMGFGAWFKNRTYLWKDSNAAFQYKRWAMQDN